MKCTPIGTNGSGCPARFDCPSLTKHDNSKCYFNGRTYAPNELVPDELVAPFCSALCYCRSGSPFAQFRCTHVDCAEFFQRFDFENCIRTYKPNSCCAKGSVCGDDKKKLAQCELEDEIYLAGQRMNPTSNKCLTCICHEGFDKSNVTNDPNCYEAICGFELFYSKHVYNGGIPVYYEDRCCPWEWRMPKDSDRIGDVATRKQEKDSTMQCKYGKLTLNVGESLVPDVAGQYTYKCSCLVPPLAQCTMTKNV